ncbi:hypothetical protein AH04_59 [Erwinia phage AH04]|uniref:Uncharacterized protein n=1 Tax=Erwinia phage AH04 TaxID=2869569 RepID=A0AAE7X275_9CAUD|nr:hypothetical protein PQC02_gp255 [Erwinia phage AH04]QZA70542.1 hypothetical protein AH04_59 [Erwinia phage AH04]
MYIKANHFNYDKLLGGIVEHLDLQDTPLDDQMVSNVFKGFESTYKELRANQKLEEWQEQIVVQFLASIQTTVMYYASSWFNDDDEPREVMGYTEVLAKLLDSLADCLTGTGDDDMIEYVDSFIDRIVTGDIKEVKFTNDLKYCLINGAELDAEQFANFLRSWVESHLSNELEGINGFLFDAINENVLPREYMKDINVMDIPGSKAKHGDTLITFPLILLEVHNR